MENVEQFEQFHFSRFWDGARSGAWGRFVEEDQWGWALEWLIGSWRIRFGFEAMELGHAVGFLPRVEVG